MSTQKLHPLIWLARRWTSWNELVCRLWHTALHRRLAERQQRLERIRHHFGEIRDPRLDPNVVLRADGGAGRPRLTGATKGAASVAGQVLRFANPAARLHPVVVNGGAGVLFTVNGRPFSLVAFTVRDRRIVEIDAITDPERVGVIAGGVLAQP